MKESETISIIVAIVITGIAFGFSEIIRLQLTQFAFIVGFAAVVIGVNILAKKAMAARLDADVEHEVWRAQRYGFQPEAHLSKSIPAGVIFPLFVTAITLGTVQLMTVLTYETRALKRRAAKRFGPYSFTEMTDFHNALVGAAGIIATLLIAFISYWLPGAGWSVLGHLATAYAFWNMIPFSKLDGAQIYFGSRVLWATLAVITLIFTAYALLLV